MLKYEDLTENEKKIVDSIKTGEWSYIMTTNIDEKINELVERFSLEINDLQVSEKDKNDLLVSLCKQNGRLGLLAEYQVTPDLAKLIEETAKAHA